MNKNIFIIGILMLMSIGLVSAFAPSLHVTYPVDGQSYIDVSQVKFNLTTPYNITGCDLNVSINGVESIISVMHPNFVIGDPNPVETIVSHSFGSAGNTTLFVECAYYNQFSDTYGMFTSSPISFIMNPSSSSGHTRYVVDANGNVLGTVYNNQLVTANPDKTVLPSFSIAGDVQQFFIKQWFSNQWTKIKNFFGGN